MTSAADDNLKHIGAAAKRYAVPDATIDFAAEHLETLDQPGRGLVEVEALLDAMLVVADGHAGPHPECIDCASIRNGLSVALGIVRAETNLALTKLIAETD